MSVALAHALVSGFEAYLVVGACFAIWFAGRGAGRLDPAAGQGTVGFRLLILPGAALLWPLLAIRLVRGGAAPPEERTAHRAAPRARR
ncbi:MAG: hypothetical protein SFV24_10860 [Gemmatimonadales bacterium]|nr:hypothetical protein [Gemmatimonadales bacterium]MDX2058291.1 hypothetical protein [Gemmatimonadales bacterium]